MAPILVAFEWGAGLVGPPGGRRRRVMYPLFAGRADAVGDHQAARLFRHNAADEAKHARAFQQKLDGCGAV